MIDRGSGRPIVLIPGIQGRWEYLAGTVNALARSHRVLTFSLSDLVSPDRRGDPFTAWAEGIASCPASMHDAEGAAKVLGLPEGHVVANVIALGYPSEERDPVQGQRPRMDVGEYVHRDRWGG